MPVPAGVREVTYRLAVVAEQHLDVVKWASEAHTIALPEGLADGSVVTVDEVWTDASHPAHLLSTSAAKVILPQRSASGADAAVAHQSPGPHESTVRFKVWCAAQQPTCNCGPACRPAGLPALEDLPATTSHPGRRRDWEVQEGEQVCIIGGAAQLGNWQLQQVLPMVQTGACCWEVEVQLPANSLPCTYKYGIKRRDSSLLLEHGENRMVALPPGGGGVDGKVPALVLRQDGFFSRQQRWQGAGVAVPVFSLRSAASVGSGEFLDLLPLVDFCTASGLCLIQLLPVSDTSVRRSWRDSYPYSSLCVFALHPIYLSLAALSGEEGSWAGGLGAGQSCIPGQASRIL